MTFSRDVPLADYTTFRIGGAAEFFIRIDDIDELVPAIRFSDRVTVIGGGSNLLVSDKGVKGLVIRMHAQSIVMQNGLVVADAGVSLARLARVYEEASLTGMEWAAMIPGSVGGACKMNAGAFDGDISRLVQWVEVLRQGHIVRLTAAQCGFIYRGSGFEPSDMIMRAAFHAVEGDKNQIRAKTEQFRTVRQSSQPAGKSAGSVFKRVKGTDVAAGWYIDRAGFKGIRAGGAEVSKLHANFILNTGGATADDVCRLICQIKAGVKEQFGVDLEEEIERIGEF